MNYAKGFIKWSAIILITSAVLTFALIYSLDKLETKAQEPPPYYEKLTSIQKDFPMDMSEKQVQNAIHAMSHQKVHSEEKWGAIPMTPDRIARLLEVVEHNIDAYVYSEAYIEILSKWIVGDFSMAVKEHNLIHTFQNGTVGEATRLMTPQEEKDYIDFYFKTDNK
jgi:Family of unknown function (DUF6241)